MISAFSNPDMPPMMSPESQGPSMFRVGMANMKETMNSPKGKVMQAMLQQSLGKLGQGMFGAAPIQHQSAQLDPYGNPIL